ncbi:MAG TPA: hypothetical protein PKZ12_02300 [Smithellaceae bacterium]|nr:hypothetical protein [Smithellaceae bacterium]
MQVLPVPLLLLPVPLLLLLLLLPVPLLLLPVPLQALQLSELLPAGVLLCSLILIMKLRKAR